jgi:hypothetical protein
MAWGSLNLCATCGHYGFERSEPNVYSKRPSSMWRRRTQASIVRIAHHPENLWAVSRRKISGFWGEKAMFQPQTDAERDN